MTKTFADSNKITLVYEGGKVDNPKDPGGRTNQGVTQNTYNTYRRRKSLAPQDVYKMTAGERDEIYMTGYWLTAGCDKLRDGVSMCVYDASVNSGPARAVIWLQQAVGLPSAQCDGVIGIKTLAAVNGVNDDDALIGRYCAIRLGTLQHLKTWHDFAKGWSARIANCKKISQAWASGSVGPDPVDVTSAGGHAKAPVTDEDMKPPLITQARAHAVTGAATVAAATTAYAPQVTGLQDTFGWAKYVAGGLVLVGILAGILVKLLGDANAEAKAGLKTADVDPGADSGFPSVPVGPPIPALGDPGPVAGVIAGGPKP